MRLTSVSTISLVKANGIIPHGSEAIQRYFVQWTGNWSFEETIDSLDYNISTIFAVLFHGFSGVPPITVHLSNSIECHQIHYHSVWQKHFRTYTVHDLDSAHLI